jgi:hypothetical protein
MASLSWDRSHEVRSGRKGEIKIEREIKSSEIQIKTRIKKADPRPAVF